MATFLVEGGNPLKGVIEPQEQKTKHFRLSVHHYSPMKMSQSQTFRKSGMC